MAVCSQRPTCITDCDGLPDGDYQSCRGCHIYASCVSGILYDYRPCNPLGLQWDDNTKRCETVSTTCGRFRSLLALTCTEQPINYITPAKVRRRHFEWSVQVLLLSIYYMGGGGNVKSCITNTDHAQSIKKNNKSLNMNND